MSFNDIAASMIGRKVTNAATGRTTIVGELSNKVGKLKDGKEGSYVILFDLVNDKEIELHPRKAHILFGKGAVEDMTLLEDVNSAADQEVFEAACAELPKAAEIIVSAKPFDVKAYVEECINAVLVEDQQLTPVDRFAEDKLDTNYPIFGEQFSTTEQSNVKPVVKGEKKVTKKSLAVAIAKNGLATGAERKDTIALMISEAGLSKAGASTYYQNIKSKKIGWE